MQYLFIVVAVKTCKYIYYKDTDEITGFFLLLKDIFIARSEDTFLPFTCEDTGVAMVTTIINQ